MARSCQEQGRAGKPISPRPETVNHVERRAWNSNPRGRVNALMVFKDIGGSLPCSVATWAFSGRARRGTQDHPVYIPRAVRWLVRCMAAEHLFRRSVPPKPLASTP